MHFVVLEPSDVLLLDGVEYYPLGGGYNQYPAGLQEVAGVADHFSMHPSPFLLDWTQSYHGFHYFDVFVLFRYFSYFLFELGDHYGALPQQKRPFGFGLVPADVGQVHGAIIFM